MFSVFTKLGWFFRAHRKRYLIALTLLLFLNFVEIAPPYLIGHAIDKMKQGTLDSHNLLAIIGIYIALIIVSYGFGVIWMYQLFGGANILQRTLRYRLMKHFLQMTPRFLEQNRTGDLMARATNDLNAVSETAGFGVLTLIDSTTFAGTIFLAMGMLVSWKLTILSLLPLPLVAFLMTKYGKIVHKRFTLAQDAFGDMNDRVLETVSGIRVIRAYVQERAEEDRFIETTEDVYQKNVAVAKIDALFEPTIKILVGITYLIGLGYGTYMVFQRQITIGQLTSFNVYLGMLIWPMLAVGELINIMQRGNASLDRVTQTLSYPADVDDSAVPDTPTKTSLYTKRASAVPEVICFNHLTFRYPTSSDDNLSEVTFSVERGQNIGLVGRTGSGKSTIIRQLLREYPPAGGGALTVNGTPIEQLPLAEVHSWIGYVPQEPMLFSRTVEENVRFGAPQATNEEVSRALNMAGFTNDIPLLPHGLQTLVGERGVSLSGGQKQRIALARALVINPEILILDDAMSAVDARTEAHIIHQIRKTRAGRTTIIATHRLSAIEHADIIIVLKDGRIVESGSHVQLLANDKWYKQQYVRQQVEQSEDDADRNADDSKEEVKV